MNDFDDLEFDKNKEQMNIKKHDGIDFVEANSVFDDPYAHTLTDYGDHNGEERYYTVGMSSQFRLMVVHWTIRDDKVRIISAYQASPNQRKYYENRTK